jgi:hypothetical protein
MFDAGAGEGVREGGGADRCVCARDGRQRRVQSQGEQIVQGGARVYRYLASEAQETRPVGLYAGPAEQFPRREFNKINWWLRGEILSTLPWRMLAVSTPAPSTP